jgi:hypothetical protein
MRRREFIAGLGSAVAWPLAARAQQGAKMLRVGTVGVQPRSVPFFVAFERRMAELGYEQGKNFALEVVPAASPEGYERGYHELAARHIDIVLAAGPEIALKSALATAGALPIVMIAIDYDPLALGYVMSLARHRHRATSRRDFVPWRCSDAGRLWCAIRSSRRHPKTCTIALVPIDPAHRRRTSNCGRLDNREAYGRFQLDQGWLTHSERRKVL